MNVQKMNILPEMADRLHTTDGLTAQRFLYDCAIAVVEREEFKLSRLTGQLLDKGFRNVTSVRELSHLAAQICPDVYDLIILDLYLETNAEKSLLFLEHARAKGYDGMLVLSACRTTFEHFFQAAKCGANDFWIKGKNLNIAAEANRLLKKSGLPNQSDWCPDRIAALGFLRTLGITQSEMRILIEFSRGFCRHQNLAHRVDISENSIRKCFSRIYKKMSRAFEVDNLAQLSHVLTVCSMYD